MSRTKKGSKGGGFDYHGKRPGNAGMCTSPGKGVKARTHRLERIQGKKEANGDER